MASSEDGPLGAPVSSSEDGPEALVKPTQRTDLEGTCRLLQRTEQGMPVTSSKRMGPEVPVASLEDRP